MRPDPNALPPVRILLLGASGRLGSAIAAALRPPTVAPPSADPHERPLQVLAPDRADRDAGRASETQPARHQPEEPLPRRYRDWPAAAGAASPDVIINCIALSDVDRCEKEAAAAMRVNAAIPRALARASREQGCHLIHFSTDFVFAGDLRRPLRESDATAPLSVYGRSKLAGEQAIMAENGSYWIFRISWLYGSGSGNLAATLLDPARAGQTLPLAGDRTGVPNPVQLIAREIAHAIRRHFARPQPAAPAGASQTVRPMPAAAGRPASGLYHLSCHGQTNWYEFAGEFVRRALAAGRIAPSGAPRLAAIDESSLQRPARRPAWSVLDPGHYERTFGRALPQWQEAIGLALQEYPG